MANFGMIDRSVAFNPISAFPLDARSYFESYADALAAAQIASTVGDTNTQYYYGETVVVVENGAAQLYIIQPDKTLVEVGSKVVVDENAFELDEDGTLKLLGLAEAEEGAQLVKSKDGSLIWVKPDTTTVEGLVGTVETLEEELGKTNTAIDEANAEIEKLNEDIVDINDSITDIESKVGDPANSELGQEATGLYAALDLKADKATTYTKTEVNTLIEEKIVEADHLRRVIVDNKEAIDKNADDALLYIYMAPSGLEEDDNKYYEYVVLEAEDGTRTIERVGSWEVNLDAYALKSSVEELTQTVASNKTSAESAIATEKARAEAAEKANADAIADVEADVLSLEEDKADKADTLAGYGITDAYTKDETYTKSETDTAIADAVKKATGGESASDVLIALDNYKKAVNAEVWGNADLEDSALTSTTSRIDTLVSDVEALAGAEANYINDVTEDFTVNTAKVLSLNDLPTSKIIGLDDSLSTIQSKVTSLDKIINGYTDEESGEPVLGLVANLAANYVTVADFNLVVGNLEEMKANNINIMTDITEIKELLSWKEMSVVNSNE